MVFLYTAWLNLPITTRIKIAEAFGIEKKGSTHVFDNKIESDGFNIREVEQAINTKALQEFLQDFETEPDKLWLKFIDKIEGKKPLESAEKIIINEALDNRERTALPLTPKKDETKENTEDKTANSPKNGGRGKGKGSEKVR